MKVIYTNFQPLPLILYILLTDGQKIANFLELHPCVEFVSHPGIRLRIIGYKVLKRL